MQLLKGGGQEVSNLASYFRPAWERTSASEYFRPQGRKQGVS